MALIDKASLLMVPSTYEDGTLYNVLPSGNKAPDETGNNNGYDQTRADFTFSRGSNLAATRVNSDGLIEKGRENLLTYSNDFSNSAWSKTSGSSVASGYSGYDGTDNAFLFTDSGTNSSYGFYQQFSFSGVLTFSIYLKAGSDDTISIDIFSSAKVARANINLTSGTITGSNDIDVKISDVSNGWYRCSVTGNLTSAIYARMGTGSAGGTFYGMNAQLEKSLVPTDYIETGSTTAQAGILEDMPRINYDANGENGALLLEPSRTNSFPYSEPFSGSGQAVSVGSYLTGDSFGIGVYGGVQLNAGSTHYYYGFSSAASTQYAVSFFVRRTDGGAPRLGTGSGDANGDFCFVASGDVYSPNDWDTTPTITLFKDDIYKFEGVLTTPAVVDNFGPLKYSNNSAINVQITGLQAEASASYPSSYVPTYGSAVTRSADFCKDAGNSDVFNDSEGVLFVEMSALADDNENRILSISDGTTSTRVLIQYYTSSNTIRGFVQGGGVSDTLSYTSSDITANTKIAFKYKSGDHALWVNGTERNTASTAITLSGLDDLSFDNGAGAASMYANVKQVAVFDEALSDSELATLTTL